MRRLVAIAYRSAMGCLDACTGLLAGTRGRNQSVHASGARVEAQQQQQADGKPAEHAPGEHLRVLAAAEANALNDLLWWWEDPASPPRHVSC